jgi:2-succinyl-5-enolpyruvyl-6-hydroxy-3-cyclohexene-1-carboxylate synthase
LNLHKAAKVIEYVRSLGVVDFCLCAGARNSPFITLLDENRHYLESTGHLYHFFEERSASFFALGRAQQTQRPVAVITTSGTAATELISAAVEAFYTKTPIIFLTADRPPSYRQTGAPQSIEQIGIFTHYAAPTVDIVDDLNVLEKLEWSHQLPLHLNVCFAEPLLQGEIPKLEEGRWATAKSLRDSDLDLDSHSGSLFELKPEAVAFLSQCKQPLFIVSGLQPNERAFVCNLLKYLKGPWWIESLSGLRGHPDLESGRIKSSERWIQQLMADRVFDGVIRIGSVPTTRVWRDLEERFTLPVLSLTNGSWSGLARSSAVAPLTALSNLCQHFTDKPHGLSDSHQDADLKISAQILWAMKRFPQSQLSLVHHLSQLVGEQPLYLGNSLPVREWDWVAAANLPNAISGNRGANGIDGQLSTFFGWKPQNTHSWALLGDLTTLYDLSAPWVVPQLNGATWTLAIMNNAGGHIFKPMFGREAFLNRHQLNFKGWAEMWNLSYQCLESLDHGLNTPPQILELRPCEIQSQLLREEINGLWTKN